MAEVKIKPLGDRVIVKPIERETMKGGIIMKKANARRWMLKKATACCMANIPAPKSNWKMKRI